MLSRSKANLSILENQNIEVVTSPSYFSYIYNHGSQLLKGAAGIIGLTAIGGLVYSGIRWFGNGNSSVGNSENQSGSNSVVTIDKIDARTNSLFGHKEVDAVANTLYNYSIQDVSLKGANSKFVAIEKDNTLGLTYIESTNYKKQEENTEEITVYSHSRKLLSSSQPPLFVNNQLDIAVGGSLVLNSTQLQAIDSDTSAENLIFTASNIQNGYFKNNGVTVTSWSQQNITNGLVSFIHDGSYAAPAYQISVSDDTNTVQSQAKITFTGAAPITAAISVPLGGQFPHIRRLSNGNFVIAGNINNAGYIYATCQLFGIDGTSIGSPWYVSTSDVTDHGGPMQSYPRVSELANGKFVVIYLSQYVSAVAEKGQIYSADGSTSGSLFQILSNDYNRMWNTVATLNNGKFVVVYQEGNSQDGSGWGIFGRLVDSDGTLIGGATLINTCTSGDQITPQIAALNNGGFVVAWTSETNGACGDGSGRGVFAQLFDASFGKVSSEFRVNTYTTNAQDVAQYNNVITSLKNGNWVIFWMSQGQNEGYYGVYGQIFSSSSTHDKIGSEIQVSASKVDQEIPSVAAFSSDKFVVIWQVGSTSTETHGQIFKNTGEKIGGEFFVLPGWGGSVTALNNGNFAAAISNSVRIFRFDNAPKLITSPLTIRRGDVLTLTESNFNNTDIDNDYRNAIYKVTSANGHFERSGAFGTAITSFSHQELINHQIAFVHSGSIDAAEIMVNVTDGYLTSAQFAVPTQVLSSISATNNNITFTYGENVYYDLPAIVVSTPSSTLSANLRINDTTAGKFDIGTSGGVTSTFYSNTATWYAAGNKDDVNGLLATLRYSPTLAFNKPISILVNITDGFSQYVANRITGIGDAAPVFVNNCLVVFQGQTVTITDAMFSATDKDSPQSSLYYRVSNVQHGQFALVSNLATALTAFTPSQIQASTVRFVHDSSSFAPSYQIVVSDGLAETLPVSGQVKFDVSPVLENNYLTICQKQSVIISNDDLFASDIDSDQNNLVFSITKIQHGRFEFTTKPGIALDKFYQANITSKLIKFIHDGTQIVPNYMVSVSDGHLSTIPSNVIVLFDISPTLVTNQLSIKKGDSVKMSGSMLLATDDDTDTAGLRFYVSNLNHGQFELLANPGIPIMDFAQVEISASNLLFRHDNSDHEPGYYVSVGDGLMNTTASKALIAFNANQETEDHTVRNALLSSLITGGIGFGLFIIEKWIEQKLKKKFEGSDIVSLVCEFLSQRVRVTTMILALCNDDAGQFEKAVNYLLSDLLSTPDINTLVENRRNDAASKIGRNILKILYDERGCCQSFVRQYMCFFRPYIFPHDLNPDRRIDTGDGNILFSEAIKYKLIEEIKAEEAKTKTMQDVGKSRSLRFFGTSKGLADNKNAMEKPINTQQPLSSSNSNSPRVEKNDMAIELGGITGYSTTTTTSNNTSSNSTMNRL